MVQLGTNFFGQKYFSCRHTLGLYLQVEFNAKLKSILSPV